MKKPTHTRTVPLLSRSLRVVEISTSKPDDLLKRLSTECGGENGFSRIESPIPPEQDSRLEVIVDRGKLTVALLLLGRKGSSRSGDFSFSGSVEVAFDLKLDGYGFVQYLFSGSGKASTNDFSPYPEAKSTAWKFPRVLEWGFRPVPTSNQSMFASEHTFFYVVFEEKEVFRWGNSVGFNVARTDPTSGKLSTWSYAAGNGVPDATSMGRLHRNPKAPLRPVRVPAFKPVKNFQIAVTNDSPMVIVNNYYTPARFDSEMKTLKEWGVSRLQWIDYSRFPGFWQMPLWSENYRKSLKACGGSLLACATEAARRHRIEFVPDFKLFDLSFICRKGTPTTSDSTDLLGVSNLECHPSLTKNQEAFMQSNPAWRQEPKFPITGLRLFSREPLPNLTAADLVIKTSNDNLTYRKLRGRVGKVSVRKIQRPNFRWTPAGVQPEPGKHTSWVLEMEGIRLHQPFVMLECSRTGVTLSNQHFAMVEAIDSSGQEVPFLVTSDRSDKYAHEFDFLSIWPGWNNYNERVLQRTRTSLSCLGIQFGMPPTLPGLLEPADPRSHKIWLDEIDFYLEHPVHGVSLRTLCHHRMSPSWIQYAFAPSVLDAFRAKYGRDPLPEEEDLVRVRRIRGEAFGEFLREASTRIRRKKRKVIFQVETGGELPPERESRMALYYDYEKWISSGLFDEFHVRAISGQSPWLRKVILPLARKHGVAVFLMTRNNAKGLGHADLLDARENARLAREAGYSGINYYESANLYEHTDGDTVRPRSLGNLCLSEAARVARMI